MFEAEAETKASRPRPKFWPRGHFSLDDLTSLVTNALSIGTKIYDQYDLGWPLNCYKFEFSQNFAGFHIFGRQQLLNEWRYPYCQRQRWKNPL